jgi:hypothetical protein
MSDSHHCPLVELVRRARIYRDANTEQVWRSVVRDNLAHNADKRGRARRESIPNAGAVSWLLIGPGYSREPVSHNPETDIIGQLS